MYDIGAFHPVVIGDKFRDGRYTFIHKLGNGGFSTVWLVRDHKTERYMALKVLTAIGSRSFNEITLQRHIFSPKLVLDNLSIVKIVDRFSFRGPNGRHTCLVLESAGPSLNFLQKQSLKLKPEYARDQRRR